MASAAIYAAALFFGRLGLEGFVIPAVGAIVGLHFIGLWKANGAWRFLWIAGAMCGVSAVTMWAPGAVATAWGLVDLRRAATGFADALVLWGLAPARSGRGRSVAVSGAAMLEPRARSAGLAP